MSVRSPSSTPTRRSKTALAPFSPSSPICSTQEANTGLRSSCSRRLRPVTDPLGRTSAVTWVSSVVSSRDRSTAWPRNPVTPVRRIRVLPPAVVDAVAEDVLCDMDSLYGRGTAGRRNRWISAVAGPPRRRRMPRWSGRRERIVAALHKALITGRTAGIGAAFARAFAGRGVSLVLVARSADRLAETAERLRREYGVEVETIVADLSDRQAQQLVADRLGSDTDPVDVFVNNAGFSVKASLLEEDLSQHDLG